MLKVQFQTRDGTATAGEDYVTVQGELVFEAGEESKTIAVRRIQRRFFRSARPSRKRSSCGKNEQRRKRRELEGKAQPLSLSLNNS